MNEPVPAKPTTGVRPSWGLLLLVLLPIAGLVYWGGYRPDFGDAARRVSDWFEPSWDGWEWPADEPALEALVRRRGLAGVTVRIPHITRPIAERIGRLKSPRQLHFEGCRIDDLSPLAELQDLEALTLEDVRLEATAIDGLARLDRIRSLDLLNVKTDLRNWGERLPTGIKNLRMDRTPLGNVLELLPRHLPQLRYLEVRAAPDAATANFARVTENLSLEDLRLPGCPVGDAELAGITNPKSLRNLFLDGTRVTDESCLHLAELPSLELLDLSETAVTALGIERVLKYRRLRELIVRKTKADRDLIRVLQDSGWNGELLLDRNELPLTPLEAASFQAKIVRCDF